MKEIDVRKKIYKALYQFEQYEIFKTVYIYTPVEFSKLVGKYVCDFINEKRHNYDWDLNTKEFQLDDKEYDLSTMWERFQIGKKYPTNKEIEDIQQTMRIVIDEEQIEKGE